jgi:CubicO group peptidase (beta-lactamase class C family)
MKTRLLLFILLILFQFSSVAQQNALVEGPANLVGMSDKKLVLIDQLIQDYINKGYIPGGVFLIARDNQIVYHKNFGFRAVDKKVPYQKDDIFRIASMTKAVTSVAIMQLFEQGKL